MRLLRDLERDWLNPTAPPLPERMAESGWAPDPPGAWCDRCGMTVGPHEGDEFGCADCREIRWPWDRFVRLGEYDEPLSAWVAEVKFTRFGSLGVALGRRLGERLVLAKPGPGPVAIVPVPASLRRRIARGVDHAGAIALGASRATGWPLVRALGARHRPAQRGLVRSERARLTGKAFTALEGIRLEGWTVVLIDDVRTTGATLAAAARAVRRGWPGVAGVWAASLAVTPAPNRLSGGVGGAAGASLHRESTPGEQSPGAGNGAQAASGADDGRESDIFDREDPRGD